MGGIVSLLLLSIAMTVVAVLGRRFAPNVPYPALMVLVGIGVAVLPGAPAVTVSPDVIKYVILPPLLYSAAWYTTWTTLRRQSVRVAGLSVGLVLATTAAVGGLVHLLHPDLPIAVGFVLGAIVAPPDAIAAAAIASRLGLPARVVALLEGESLINDATALILYKLALGIVIGGAATVGAASTITGAIGSFAFTAVGGIALGVGMGMALVFAHRRLKDPLLATVLTLQAPYLAFLPAEAMHLSGVLAAVVAGLIVGRHSAGLFSPALRLQAIAVWDVAVFLLAGFAFVLIGLAVKPVIGAASASALSTLARDAVLICLAIIVVRIVWMLLDVLIERAWSAVARRPGNSDQTGKLLSAAETAVVSWAGMRGVLSLAAALAVPLTVADGGPFPFRDEILALTFAAIVATLLGQGLSLPWLIGRLRLGEGEGTSLLAARRARRSSTDAALAMLQARAASTDDADHVDVLSAIYRRRRAALSDQIDTLERGDGGGGAGQLADAPLDRAAELHLEALATERARVVELRNQGTIDDETLHHVLRSLDLEDAHLAPTPQTRGIV